MYCWSCVCVANSWSVTFICHFNLSLFVCLFRLFFFFNDTATTEIYTLSLHDALPISLLRIKKRITMMNNETKHFCSVSASNVVNDMKNFLITSQGSKFCDFTLVLQGEKIPAHKAVLADRKSTRLNSSHPSRSRMPSSA